MGAASTISISVPATKEVIDALGPLLKGAGIKIGIHGRDRVNIATAAKIAKCHHTTIRGAIHDGILPAYQPGREIEIELTDLTEWYESKMVRPNKDARLLENLHPKVAARYKELQDR